MRCVPCRRGWFGSAESLTGLRVCEPCAPYTLQPLPGQASCVACPSSGVDCTVQDRLEVLPGYFLDFNVSALMADSAAAAPEAVNSGIYTISVTVASTIDAFDNSTFETRLRAFLECDEPACSVALLLSAASVRVLAAVNDSTATTMAAAERLSQLNTSTLSDVLGVPCEGSASLSYGSSSGGGGETLYVLDSQGLMTPTRCPRQAQCLGGSNSSCSSGSTGVLCGNCQADYYRRNGVCNLCDSDAAPSLAVYGGGATLALLAGFIYMVLQLRVASLHDGAVSPATGKSRAATAWSQRRRPRGACSSLLAQLRQRSNSSGTVAKILLAYFQVLNAFSQLQSIAWPPLFQRFLDALSPLSFEIFSVSPLGCVFDVDVTTAHELLSVLMLPPLAAMVVLLIAWLAAQCTLPAGERSLCQVAVRPETCTLQLWLMLLLYPSLAKTAVVPFDCMTVGERRLLRAAPQVACDDPAQWNDIAMLGGIGTVLYSIGFPLLCFVVTRSARNGSLAAQAAQAAMAAQAAEEADSAAAAAAAAAAQQIVYEATQKRAPKASKAKTAGRKSAPSRKGGGQNNAKAEEPRASVVAAESREQFGRARLLMYSYHENYWYWESLDIFRKYLLTSVVLVVAHDSLLQVYLGVLICVVALVFVSRHQPYASPFCGRLQLLCLTQRSRSRTCLACSSSATATAAGRGRATPSMACSTRTAGRSSSSSPICSGSSCSPSARAARRARRWATCRPSCRSNARRR